MKIAFVQPNTWMRYDVTTPMTRPFGGSEAAQCHLATEMARAGHRIVLMTGIAQETEAHGVRTVNVAKNLPLLRTMDAIVVLNSMFGLGELRQEAGDVPIIVWEQSTIQENSEFYSSERSPLFDAIVFVSEWHRQHSIPLVPVDQRRMFVARNAIGPAFADLFAHGERILDRKAWPPLMAFTSTPMKGLRPLLMLFPAIRDYYGPVTLNVFSDLARYPANAVQKDSEWSEDYGRCRNTLGMNYIGAVGPQELRRALLGTSVLCYPNIAEETSSIAVMEAMAAGCLVVAPALGALPETMAGFGQLVPLSAPSTFGGNDFCVATIQALKAMTSNREDVEQRLREQVRFVNENYRWHLRVRTWEEILRAAMNDAAQTRSGR